MRQSFFPKLVNGPFQDPALFIPFVHEKRAILFDLGEIYGLSAREILKTSHVFISHTHIDHFVGFDRFLRILIGRNKTVCMFGPPGFIANVEGKLSGYTWNLLFDRPFKLLVIEVTPDRLIRKLYTCEKGLLPGEQLPDIPYTGYLLNEDHLTIRTAFLDHRIPCLGFRLEEKFHINIIKARLDEMNIPTGPWLSQFKKWLINKKNSNDIITINENHAYPIGELAERIALITPGQKIAYITDVIYSESNIHQILDLAQDVDHLYIEAAFSQSEEQLAFEKYHLTSYQSGKLAKKAGAKALTVFHFSPRYMHKPQLIENEALKAFTTDE